MVEPFDGPDHDLRGGGGTGRQDDGPILRLADVLHPLAVLLHRMLRRADAASGVSTAQLSALRTLVQDGPHTVGELADAEQVSAPTMTRLVQGLDALELVTRAPDALDRRAVRVSATRRGRALLRAQRAHAVVELAARVRGLPPSDVAALASASVILAELLRTKRDGGRTSARGGHGSSPDVDAAAGALETGSARE